MEELRTELIQRGKHRRLIYTQHLHTSDEAVIHQMIRDGMFQKQRNDMMMDNKNAGSTPATDETTML
jgi:hypothetical protein